MTVRRRWVIVGAGVAAFVMLCLLAAEQAAEVAAAGLLHPYRRHVRQQPPPGCADATFAGAGVKLAGWRCGASAQRRAALILLHGVANNRASVAGVVGRFTARGLEVIAYDSRGHGESAGDICTYGYWEKADLARVVQAMPAGPVILLGTSLGAAVALQEAAADARVAGVVAAETFSDLRTVVRERAPWFLPAPVVWRAFVIAESRGGFRADAVSPVEAARRIRVPVLLVHGARDVNTPPDHSRRVLAALHGPKELLLVEGAGHNQSLGVESAWQRIERWVEEVLARVGEPGGSPHASDGARPRG